MASRLSQNYQVYRKYWHQIASLYRTRTDVQAFTELVLSLFTISFFGAFAIRPTLVTIAQLTTDIKSKEEVVAKLDTKINALTSAQALYNSKLNQINILESAIPKSSEPHTYVRQVEGLTKKDGVSLVSINIEKVDLINAENIASAEAEPQNQDFKIDFTVSGSFSSLSAFLTDLENLRRPLLHDITSIATIETENGKEIVLSVEAQIPYTI